MRPTAMLFRNLASMDVEEAIRANPLDGVVLLGGCDKTTPALLMGAASADVPAVLVTGGPQLNGNWRGEDVGSCTDCRRYQTELRAGRITEADWAELQGCIIRSAGHCMTMGTASTMACVVEALGIAPPGNGATPAPDSRRLQIAEAAGRYAVELAERDVRPSHILTPAAFDNAIRVLHAIGGSTNAVIHLVAIAGRLGLDLPLDRFDELARTTPFLLDLKPAGRFLMEDFFHAGGVPALVAELAPLLDLDRADRNRPDARRELRRGEGLEPRRDPPARGADSPGGRAGGAARVARAGRGDHQADRRDARPCSRTAAGRSCSRTTTTCIPADGRPEPRRAARRRAGAARTPARSAARGCRSGASCRSRRSCSRPGVRDMVRISDARMSGTAFGTVVVHVSPESAVGGPLAAVRDGDLIELDVPNRRLGVARRARRDRPAAGGTAAQTPRPERGYGWLYARHVLQAEAGCDFDFLRATAR